MTTDSPKQFRQTISAPEFIFKLLAISWRIPFIIYHAVSGLKRISGDRKLSWASTLEDIAARYPDNMAVKSPDGMLTYRELNESANRFAHFLISRKICAGDVVTVCMENRPELLVAYCGCGKVGAVCSLINTNQRGDSLIHSFNLNKGRLLFVGEECLEFFDKVKGSVDLKNSELYIVGDPAIKRLNAKEDVTKALSGMPAANPPTTSDISMKDRIAYVYTSGTTGGMPKAAVIINKRALSAMFWFGRVVTRIRPHHTVYVPLPFFHTNALTVGWPAALYNGAAVALRRRFSASNFLEDIRNFRVTHFVYVGEVCRYLMAQPDVKGQNRTTLKYVIGNGLRPDIWKAFKKRYGIKKVFEFYGAAEGVGVFTNFLNFDYSVGTSLTSFAIVNYDIENDRVARDANGFLTRVKKGEAGLLIMEITEKTPFTGYSDKKKTEEKIIRDAFKKGDSWFNTGDMLIDMGFRHAQFADRLGDTFRWKGENVATMEVEKAIDSFKGVEASAVYGVSLPAGDGRAGMAAIIRQKDAKIDLAGLVGHLRSALPKYAVPLFVRFIEDFQWTATHKINKTGLKSDEFDPSRVGGKVYVLLPDSDEYVEMTGAIHREIMAGKYRF
ncbi:MAG: Long-chain-fatty-acid--CoA ligase [Spirochaetes bacterium ADurb.BinA120]|nr:MAG: Long-chain-fatty-acid--CoA ligase [Spirochaetes bacterium ADurb.BinA120]